jgi:hypothetical protein
MHTDKPDILIHGDSQVFVNITHVVAFLTHTAESWRAQRKSSLTPRFWRLPGEHGLEMPLIEKVAT